MPPLFYHKVWKKEDEYVIIYKEKIVGVITMAIAANEYVVLDVETNAF
ncbi:MAG: hypothetical protein J6B80_06935 [Clostridia bacterium]|nr:hypothetical protein [Clostridia bacterium]